MIGGTLRLARLKARRRLWLKAHLWLGLVAGAALVVFGITGSILVFWQEIDERLAPKLLRVRPAAAGEAAFRPPAEIFNAGTRAMPPEAVLMDRYSGKLLDVDDPTTGTAGEVFTHWQWPLYSGQGFGMPGRLAVFVTGLAGPLLFVTGLIRWLQKHRARRVKSCVVRSA